MVTTRSMSAASVDNHDYMSPEAIRTRLPAMEASFEGICQRRLVFAIMNNEDIDAEDLIHQSIILTVMHNLAGAQAGVPLDRDRVRYWTYRFRLDSMGEDPEDLAAAVHRDNQEAETDQEEEPILS